MKAVTQPAKEQVRNWLMQRQAQRTPLPDSEQIRRQLGWYLLDKRRTS